MIALPNFRFIVASILLTWIEQRQTAVGFVHTGIPLMLKSSPLLNRQAKVTSSSLLATSTRSEFMSSFTTISSLAFIVTPKNSQAFEGGVGGLGKTKPETGVVFRDSSTALLPSDGGGDIVNELLGPGETPVLVSFNAPWPMLRSSTSIESRDLANPEAAFVQVANKNASSKLAKNGELSADFFREAIFGPTGKFGAYGAPSDIKIKKVVTVSTDDASQSTIYEAFFTTLTPSMRESDRKVFISTKIVGDGVFMLVTGTTMTRFKKQEPILRHVADSFRVVPAPKSRLRSSQ